MDYSDALRRTAYYKGVGWLSALVGIGFVLAGYRLSLGGLPLSRAAAIEGAKSPAFAALALLGFVVWQLGSTVAFYKSMTEAVDEQMAERFDPEMIKSDVLSVLDERLADMQTQVEGTRRAVEDLGGAEAGGNFEFED